MGFYGFCPEFWSCPFDGLERHPKFWSCLFDGFLAGHKKTCVLCCVVILCTSAQTRKHEGTRRPTTHPTFGTPSTASPRPEPVPDAGSRRAHTHTHAHTTTHSRQEHPKASRECQCPRSHKGAAPPAAQGGHARSPDQGGHPPGQPPRPSLTPSPSPPRLVPSKSTPHSMGTIPNPSIPHHEVQGSTRQTMNSHKIP